MHYASITEFKICLVHQLKKTLKHVYRIQKKIEQTLLSEQSNKKRSYKRADTKTDDQGEDEFGPGHLLLLHHHLFGPQHEPTLLMYPLLC